MSFQSLSFLAFLALTAAVCLSLGRRNRQAGELCLTIACLVFYLLGGGWTAFLVLALGTAVTTLALQRLCGADSPARKRTMVLACAYHIGVLVVFKYTGFLTGGAVSIGWAPLGLSFFTFQQLWLLKEGYTRQYAPAQGDNLILHAFFFPTVTSGPILRPGALFPQMRGEAFLRPGWEDIAAGLYAICCGMGKKIFLADAFGAVVNNGWARIGELSAPAAWLVMLGYTFQLYFDFSGYCDVAAGCARLLGVRLPVNFNSPYRALSVGDFWRRWHITLTTFLRECLYFPLGGSRKGNARAYLNILMIFLVSGWWHGAGWTFLVWGALHGLAQIVERAWGNGRDRLPKLLRWGMTFLFVTFAWVFFRAPGLADAGDLLAQAVSGGLAKPEPWLLAGVFSKETSAIQLLFPACKPWLNMARIVLLYGAGLLVVLTPRNTIQRMDTFRPRWWNCTLMALLLTWSVLSFTGITTFIYSNF